jgi:uncharacterized protein YdiU (UPF0061 family)
MNFAFDNTYARLPARFFASVSPTSVLAPRLVKVNRELAGDLGLDPDELPSPAGVLSVTEPVVVSSSRSGRRAGCLPQVPFDRTEWSRW